MRLAAEDIARSLRGSWRLMSEGAEALPDLDLSREGFWRSFLALALMAPATIALLAATRLFAGLPNTVGLFAAPGLVVSVVGALLLTILVVPAFLILLRPELAREARFTSFVIAWNWAGIVSASLMALPAAVFALGWSTPQLAIAQFAAFGIVVLRLRYGVARAAFGGGGVALLLVSASIVLDYGVVRLFGLA
ncbi:MAG: hypothetical protein ACTHP8_13510 [Bosea sp. (in: a-proteobacteria)]|uniref:hypothetical protein n=1 Tax=unclassified Bosea (in: a-proteobacteria) TaxID=2653178 RepID=UPI000965E016|nr:MULTISPECIES: hypothetical protein [unclassified Bosea (in: a-proteobacteria)]MBN9459164.1 hypothetical protein [Bosea sp. (in: a-proteobacteria)]OJV06488.1 MAG: hypothetical protein BGO20_09735 [Bosea sp. 67-29]